MQPHGADAAGMRLMEESYSPLIKGVHVPTGLQANGTAVTWVVTNLQIHVWTGLKALEPHRALSPIQAFPQASRELSAICQRYDLPLDKRTRIFSLMEPSTAPSPQCWPARCTL
jgi:hypothetical protein